MRDNYEALIKNPWIIYWEKFSVEELEENFEKDSGFFKNRGKRFKRLLGGGFRLEAI